MAEKQEKPVEKITLSHEQIEEICGEIEHQWLYLLMTRAVFHAHFPDGVNPYDSPPFYSSRGIRFKVTLPEEKTDAFIKGAQGLANWHNQNYVIRLYGILEKYQIMFSGRKVYGNKLMNLLYELRPKKGLMALGAKQQIKDT